MSEAQKSFMLSVQIEQEPIIGVQFFYWIRAGRCEEDNRVGPVCVMIYQQAGGGRRATPLA